MMLTKFCEGGEVSTVRQTSIESLCNISDTVIDQTWKIGRFGCRVAL